MKKMISSVLVIIILLMGSISAKAASPYTQTTEVLDLEGGYRAIITKEVYDSTNNSKSTTSYKSSTLTYELESESGEIVAIYKLKGTFSYNGVTSSCTSASHTTTILSDGWKFTSATSARSGNKAVGSFTAKKIILGVTFQTISDKVTLTCDKNGNIY